MAVSRKTRTPGDFCTPYIEEGALLRRLRLPNEWPNGPRLSCGRLASRRKRSGRWSVPGHNTTAPFETRAPASKRMLGGSPSTSAAQPELGQRNQLCHLVRCKLAFYDDAPTAAIPDHVLVG